MTTFPACKDTDCPSRENCARYTEDEDARPIVAYNRLGGELDQCDAYLPKPRDTKKTEPKTATKETPADPKK